MDELLHRTPPTVWERFRSNPLLFLARLLYSPPIQSNSSSRSIRIVCISDTHNTHLSQPPLPPGDILIHAGDLTLSGTQQEHDAVLSWLESLPYPHKFFVAGNHDSFLAHPDALQYVSSKYPSLTYLQESSAEVTIRGRMLRIYGSPYTPKHGSWVFQYPRAHPALYSTSQNEDQATKIWSRVPLLTDILVTHGPPLGHLDNNVAAAGCYALLAALWRVRPKVHVFGHIHVGRGVRVVNWDAQQKAYEQVIAGRVGWMGLLSLVRNSILALFCGESRGEEGATVMVNAAAVAGFRDDQTKGAILIEI